MASSEPSKLAVIGPRNLSINKIISCYRLCHWRIILLILTQNDKLLSEIILMIVLLVISKWALQSVKCCKTAENISQQIYFMRTTLQSVGFNRQRQQQHPEHPSPPLFIQTNINMLMIILSHNNMSRLNLNIKQTWYEIVHRNYILQ